MMDERQSAAISAYRAAFEAMELADNAVEDAWNEARRAGVDVSDLDAARDSMTA